MDSSGQGRPRQHGAVPTSKPAARPQRATGRRPVPGKLREAKDSSEIIRVSTRVEAIAAERPSLERRSTDDDPNARHFTVANVGRNGTVYLRPSRFQVPLVQTPATPPGTSDGKEKMTMDNISRRPSAMSGTWTPRVPAPKGTAFNTTVPVPPLSMANVHDRRRTRSHSFSSVDVTRTPTFDSNDFQVLVNGREAERPKSSVDLTEALMDLRIPHYRLGTPRFSERGTAYLHNSVYTSNSEDVRSSVFSRGDYEKLFPAPPGQEHARHSTSTYLHPSRAKSLTPSRMSQSPSGSPPGGISPAVYDKVEARINDATLVRYSPATGRITAATPARLIAQITSPLFLDYELLADFFLTFRSFLSCSDMLEYMLARMRWALSNDSDAGRIVRVRTFVALRHWILNYFADDFIPALDLRERFCKLVNGLTVSLQRRDDQGGTDMNVIGELKKCWRRTCAKYWPVPNALDTSPEAAILPGEDLTALGRVVSTMSLPTAVLPSPSQLDFRRSSVIQLPSNVEKTDEGVVRFEAPRTPPRHTRTASIPTSPMSEDSLTVLSCSVPFLKNMLLAKEPQQPPRGPSRSPAHEKSRSTHGHKRSGSFSDALRDKRPPLPSAQPDGIDLRALQSLTFTGGLVRGLLLQPSPSKVELLVPLSPPMEVPPSRLSSSGESYFNDTQYQSVGMRRIVGDVRRALSNRRGRHDSPASSNRSTNSSDSHNSVVQSGGEGSNSNLNGWQQLGGPPRIDVLAEQIEGSYKEAFQNIDELAAEKQVGAGAGDERLSSFARQDGRSDTLPVPSLNRLDSHVTTGSRSIVIMDDTGIPPMPSSIGALPSVSSWSSGVAPAPIHRNAQDAFDEWERSKSAPRSGSFTAVASESHRAPSTDLNMHDLLAVPDSWQTGTAKEDQPHGRTPARKSSSVHPVEMPAIRKQLRRRPGGDDLKAADRVHDLEPAPRHHYGDSYSTITSSVDSAGDLHESTSAHLSGQMSTTQGSLKLLPTHSSQPNMRPSLNRQVSHLKRLPDGDLEGGIEDALAKLEGKPSSMAASELTPTDGQPPSLLPLRRVEGPRSSSVRYARVSAPNQAADSLDGGTVKSPTTDRQGASIYHMSDSELDDDPIRPKGRVLRAINPDSLTTASSGDCAIESVDFADLQRGPLMFKPAEIRTPPQLASSPPLPNLGTPQGSFLLDDNESLSDISTEIADQSEDESFGVRSFFFDETPGDDLMMPSPAFRPPPTPPPTEGPSTIVSTASGASQLVAPIVSTNNKTLKEAASAPKLFSSSKQDSKLEPRPSDLRRVRTSPSQPQIAHLPFVLAFESDIIAEQLTIIEKDALDEVEWKDLVSLSWQQNPIYMRNWVEFLTKDSNGIDIVIGRFNLVVKWVVSECLLTEAPSERAKCITKYIHIASHCHRLRNYASMYQITLALLSADMARLHQTWTLIAPTEKATLDRLEKLCQPVRNFHNLRSEMEAASANEACIPFIGLYTHDLMFNAQKPGLIDSLPPGGEKLVNFERYQTAATIVKSLLRLIEASSKYTFRPHPEVLSRCLWLAALDDQEIVARSKTLEST